MNTQNKRIIRISQNALKLCWFMMSQDECFFLHRHRKLCYCSGKTSIRQNSFKVVYLIGRFHDHLDVEVLRSHGQQLVVVIPDIPGVARDALKLLEGGRLLGFAWSGWRRLVACFDQTEEKNRIMGKKEVVLKKEEKRDAFLKSHR